jgi:hypothetical protein
MLVILEARLLAVFVEIVIVEEVNINADVFLNKLGQINNDKISLLLVTC